MLLLVPMLGDSRSQFWLPGPGQLDMEGFRGMVQLTSLVNNRTWKLYFSTHVDHQSPPNNFRISFRLTDDIVVGELYDPSARAPGVTFFWEIFEEYKSPNFSQLSYKAVAWPPRSAPSEHVLCGVQVIPYLTVTSASVGERPFLIGIGNNFTLVCKSTGFQGGFSCTINEVVNSSLNVWRRGEVIQMWLSVPQFNCQVLLTPEMVDITVGEFAPWTPTLVVGLRLRFFLTSSLEVETAHRTNNVLLGTPSVNAQSRISSGESSEPPNHPQRGRRKRKQAMPRKLDDLMIPDDE